MTLSVIILAAGKGTRMNSEKLKVFHEVGNYPLIFHVLDTVSKLKPEKCFVVISPEMEEKKSEISKKFGFVEFSVQKNQLGTADAVKSVRELKSNNKSDTTIILYADTPLIELQTLKKIIKLVQEKKSDLSILSMKPENPKQYGRLKITGKNSVLKIIEDSEASIEEKKIKICNSGVMAINTGLLIENLEKIKNNNSKKEFYLTDLVEIFNEIKRKVSHFECDFYETMGINNRNDLQEVDNFFQEKIKKDAIDKGVTFLDKKSVYMSYDTKIGNDSVIFPNVYFGKNVEIQKNVSIKSFCHFEDVTIKKDCEIGPFARIRGETIIEKDVKVGNFVEIKKSRINKKTKIAHLSYIGDAVVGYNTNIGAGTITCNYDGFDKHQTIIGNNCFIGSNSSLIAPIEINENSIVGAGTVLKSNIASHTTVFRKSELIKKKNKKKKN